MSFVDCEFNPTKGLPNHFLHKYLIFVSHLFRVPQDVPTDTTIVAYSGRKRVREPPYVGTRT